MPTIIFTFPEPTQAELCARRMAWALIREEAVVLTYRDKDGVVSTRRVVPRHIKVCQNGIKAVYCWDLNRRDVRCFRISGIVNVGTDRPLR